MNRGQRVVKKTGGIYRSKPKSRSKVKLDFGAFKSPLRLLVLAVAVVLVWNYFGVKEIIVSGNKNIEAAKIESAVRQSFKGRPLTKNLLTLRPASLEEDLQEYDHRLKTVKVKRRWPSKVLVDVTEREVALIWKSGAENFVIDSEGVVVGRAEELGLKLPEIVDSTNLPVRVGTRVVSSRFVNFCLGLVANMPQKTGLRINSIKVPETTSEVYVSTHLGYLVKFDTTRSIEEQIDDLNSVLATLAGQRKRPQEYIDLRIAGKAYYR